MSRIIINNQSSCTNLQALHMVSEVVGYGKTHLGLKGKQYKPYYITFGKYSITATKNKESDSFTITELKTKV